MFLKELRKVLGSKNKEVSAKFSIPEYTKIKLRDFCMINSAWWQRFVQKLYNDQRNAKVLNLCIYLLPPYMFRVNRKPETCKAEVNR
jgi:hypothetical protein